jgi:hypothetical protein
MMHLSAKKSFLAIFSMGLCSLLAACGWWPYEQGTTTITTTTAPPPGSFSQTYTASLTAGEVVEMGINTATMSYTFKVLLSSYNLAGNSGLGRMTSQNTDGSFNLAASSDGFIQGGKIYAVKNGTLSGYIKATFTTGTYDVPVIGTSNSLKSVSNLAGTYNYVSFSCPTPSNGNYQATPGCTSDYGTIQINSNNIYTRCSKQDLTSVTPCTSQTSGALSAAQSQSAPITLFAGVFNFTPTWAATSSAWIFGYTAANGNKVAVIDFNDSSPGGYGYGQAILTTQVPVAPSDIAGNYALFNLIDGDKTTSIQGTGYSSSISITPTVSPIGILNPNVPWQGMINWADSGGTSDGYAVIAGTGIFASQMAVAPGAYLYTNKWFEFGMKH